MLETACREAENVLLDQRLILLVGIGLILMKLRPGVISGLLL